MEMRSATVLMLRTISTPLGRILTERRASRRSDRRRVHRAAKIEKLRAACVRPAAGAQPWSGLATGSAGGAAISHRALGTGSRACPNGSALTGSTIALLDTGDGYHRVAHVAIGATSAAVPFCLRGERE